MVLSVNHMVTISNILAMKLNFHLLNILFTLILSCTILNCCTEKDIEPITVESISLSTSYIELIEGENKHISAIILPQNAANKSVIWASSNSSVATVSDGIVTALKAGKARITAKTEDSGKTAICEVTVVAKVYNVESITLDRMSVELMEGEDTTLLPNIMPENASNKNVVWSSSDEAIAIVEEGKVTAIKEGKVTVTVTTVDGNKTAACSITVMNNPMADPIVFADSIIKGMCLDAFDANNDGELSYKEAASVTDLTKMQLINSGFVSFDEFQYFTNVTVIPDSYFASHQSLKSIILPENIKIIGNSAFSGTFIESITLPESVEVLGANAFNSCVYLEKVIMSSNIQHIEQYTFSFCFNLKNIILPQKLQSIRNSAFFACQSLESITLPNSLTTIGDGIDDNPNPESVFHNCSALRSITIPQNVTYIGNSAFSTCSSLSEVIILGQISSIERGTFSGCRKLESIVLPESLREIEHGAFAYCENISKVDVGSIASWCQVLFEKNDNNMYPPNSSNPISSGADLYVKGEKITDLIIPKGVKTVTNKAFYNCTSIKTLTVAEDILYIGAGAFSNCNYLKDVYCKSPEPPVLADISSIISYSPIDFQLTNFYVPYKSLNRYKTAEIWKSYYSEGTEWHPHPNFYGYDFENDVVIE